MRAARQDQQRPDCYGSGTDAHSGQRIPMSHCRTCEHVTGCSLLRQARAAERAIDVLDEIARHMAPYGDGQVRRRW